MIGEWAPGVLDHVRSVLAPLNNIYLIKSKFCDNCMIFYFTLVRLNKKEVLSTGWREIIIW